MAEFVARARRLSDGDRVAIAAARAEVDEEFHEQALRAAAEALVGRGDAYARARAELARAHLPDGIADEPERLAPVARLAQLAIDEMLLAAVTSDVLHPKHLRQLSRAWMALPDT